MKALSQTTRYIAIVLAILFFSLLGKGIFSPADLSAAPLTLGVGGCAEVYGSNSSGGLRVRSGPGTGYSQVGSLYDGTKVRITGGPTNANGYTWWQHDRGGWSGGNWLRDTSCSSGSGNIQLVDGLRFSPSSPQVNQSTNAYFNAKNNGSASITLEYLGVKCRRNSDDANFDYFWHTNVSLSPGQEFRYDANRSFDRTGSYWCTANYRQGGNWNDVKWSNGSTNYVTVNVQSAPTPTPVPSGRLILIQDLSLSNSNPAIGENITGSFRVRNAGGQAITLEYLGIQGRINGDVNSTARDFDWVRNLTLQPGQEYSYSVSRNFDIAGNWTLRPNYKEQGRDWNDVHRDNGTVNTVWITVKTPTPGKLVLIQDMSVSNTNPTKNEDITASFRVKNTGGQPIILEYLGVQGRLNGDVNSTARDFNWVQNLTLQPGQEYPYSSNRSFDTTGNWTLRPNYKEQGQDWNDVHRENGTVNTVSISVKAPPAGKLVLVQDLSLSNMNAFIGENISAGYKVKNTGGQPITLEYLGIQGRLNGDVNSTARDFDWKQNLTLQPGEEYTYSSSRSFDIAASWSLRPNYREKGQDWNDVHRENGSVNTVWITVKQGETQSPGKLVLIQDLSASESNPIHNTNIAGSFRVKNIGGQPLALEYLGIQGRLDGDLNSAVADFAWVQNLNLAPGEEYLYSASRRFDIVGRWSLRPNFKPKGSDWSDVHRENGSVNQVWITVRDDTAPLPENPPQTRTGIRATITVDRAQLPADGVAQAIATICLHDSSGSSVPNREIRIFSSRRQIDVISPSVGFTNSSGCLSASIRSTQPGEAILSAKDLTGDQFVGASTSVVFVSGSNGNAPLPPAGNYRIAITHVRTAHSLDSAFLQGITLPNRIQVWVDWKGTTPGKAVFRLNDNRPIEQSLTSDLAQYTFDMGSDLKPGKNILQITVYNAAGQPSQTATYQPYQVAQPQWLQALTNVVFYPKIAGGQLGASQEFEMRYPASPVKIGAPIGFGRLDMQFRFFGKLSVPFDCTSPLSLSGGIDSGEITFLGGHLQVKGQIGGQADRRYCLLVEPSGSWKVEGAYTKTLISKPILVMVTYLNVGVGQTIDTIVAVLHMEEYIAKLGEFYLDAKPRFTAEGDFSLRNSFPYIVSDLTAGGGIGFEGGIRGDWGAVKAKIYAAADGIVEAYSPEFSLNPNDFTFDRIVIGGEIGAEFEAWRLVRSAKGRIEWVFPAGARQAELRVNTVTSTDWHMAGRGAAPSQSMIQDTNQSRLRAMDAGMPSDGSSTLMRNVYTYTQASLATRPDNQALLVWVHDDPAKPISQGLELVYSRWDGNAWTTDVPVTNDSYLDTTPQIAWDSNNNGILVWERVNDPNIPITSTLNADFTRKLEIATSTYNATANSWSAPSLLTVNSATDHSPVLSRNSDGHIMLVWRQNQAGQLVGTQEYPDTVLYRVWDGVTWSDTNVVSLGMSAIQDIAVAYGEGSAMLAFSQAVSDPQEIANTNEIFISQWDGSNWSIPQQLTADDGWNNMQPQLGRSPAGDYVLVWLAGTHLKSRNLGTGVEIEIPLSSDMAVTSLTLSVGSDGSMALTWLGQTGAANKVYASVYDVAQDSWGRPRPLLDDAQSKDNLAPQIDNTGSLIMAYTSANVTSEVQTLTLANGQPITFTLSNDGPMDLNVLRFSPTRDVVILGIQAEDESPAPGATVALTATIRNTGSFALDDVAVTFYEGNPSLGVVIGSKHLSTLLTAGDSTILSTQYVIPDSGGIRQIYAVVDPDNRINESDETNNTVTLAAFGPDLVIESVAIDEWGHGHLDMMAYISNEGTSVSPESTISFYLDSIAGALVMTNTVPAIEPGQLVSVTTPLQIAGANGRMAQRDTALIAVVNQDESSFAEIIVDNNTSLVKIDSLPDLAADPFYFWAEYQADGSVAVTTTIFNFGSLASGAFDVSLHIDEPFTDTSRITQWTSSGLEANGQMQLTTTLVITGNHQIFVRVDPNDAILEMSDQNNLASTQLYESQSPGDMTPFVEFTVPITRGLNLLSGPLHPTDLAIDHILKLDASEYRVIYAYSGCAANDPWKKNDPNAPSFANDLNQLDETMGWWLDSLIATNLHFTGTISSDIAIQVCPGWNLVGYPRTESQIVHDALASIDGCYTRVYAYDTFDVDDPWKKYDPAAPDFANDLKEMKPGFGYWIQATKQCMWKP